MNRTRWIATGLNGALAVAFAAFGAHALPADLADRLRHAYDVGAELHLVHAAALAALAGQPRRFGIAFWLMLAGVLLFSASLYALALTGARPLALVTPLGGVALVAAWISVAAVGGVDSGSTGSRAG